MSTTIEDIRFREAQALRKAELTADEAQLAAIKVKQNRDAAVKRAADLLVATPAGKALSQQDFLDFRGHVQAAESLDRGLEILRKVEKENRNAVKYDVHVGAEPRTYHADSEHSYFADLAASALPPNHPEHQAASARLARYEQEIRGEMASGSKEGRRARRTLQNREAPIEEQRAMSSGSTSGGPWVTPEYLVDLFATFRSPARSFVDQCRNFPLPAYGLTINVPSFASATSVLPQGAENSGTADVEPTGADLSTTLTTLAGQIVVSQQLFDRGGSVDAGSFDQIALEQIRSQLDAQVDLYVLTQALAGAGTVTDGTTLTTALFYTDLATAREQLADTAGVRLAGSHLYSTTDVHGWFGRQMATTGAPVVSPVAAPVSDADAAAGFTGLVLPGGLRYFTDDNIPASSGNAQVLVARPDQILVWGADPDEAMSFAYPSTDAGTLSVVIGLRAYCGAIVKHAHAVSVISGAGYAGLN